MGNFLSDTSKLIPDKKEFPLMDYKFTKKDILFIDNRIDVILDKLFDIKKIKKHPFTVLLLSIISNSFEDQFDHYKEYFYIYWYHRKWNSFSKSFF